MSRRLVVAAVTAALAVFALPQPAAARADVDHWQLDFLHATQANSISQGEGVVVAVVDTGVDLHPDLAGSVVPGIALDGAGNSDGTTDTAGHGTAMAGLIAAHGMMVGIAPRAKIMPIQATTSLSIPDGIDWATQHGAQVINVSTAAGPSDRLKDAVDRALAAGVVIVASAGNAPAEKSVAYPAAYQGVLAAAAVNRAGQHSAVSVVGTEVVLAAPGDDIESTIQGGEYLRASGTSNSSALISGVAALVKAKFPNLSGREIGHRLIATADDAGTPGRDPEYGYGIVNPVKALTADVPPLRDTPAATAPATPGATAAAGPPARSAGSPGSVIALVVIIIVAAVVTVAGIITVAVVAVTSRRRHGP